MEENVIFTKEIELLDQNYWVYLKEVPTKISPGGAPEKTTIRAFIKKQ